MKHVNWKRIADHQYEVGKSRKARELKARLDGFRETIRHYKQHPEMMGLSGDGEYLMAYIGSSIALDPCGKYHSFLHGAPDECEDFWTAFYKAAEDEGLWVEHSECDPLDVFLCAALPSESEVYSGFENWA